MSLDHLSLSKNARKLLRQHSIQSIDQARSWTQWGNISNIRDVYREHANEIGEIQLAVARYDQQKGRTFQDSYVAFIDILGFAQLASVADTDEKSRETIRSGLRCFSSILGLYPNADLQFSQFSDTIVLSGKRDENGLFYVLEATIRIAEELLKAGLLVRGGIAAGNLEHTDEMLFGRALVDAYALERSGGPPRIIVSEAVMDDEPSQRLLKDIWSASTFVDDFDLSCAVHTLLHVQTYHDDRMSGFTRADAMTVAGEIEKWANDVSVSANIRSKWRWMARYWNRTVSESGLLPAVDLKEVA